MLLKERFVSRGHPTNHKNTELSKQGWCDEYTNHDGPPRATAQNWALDIVPGNGLAWQQQREALVLWRIDTPVYWGAEPVGEEKVHGQRITIIQAKGPDSSHFQHNSAYWPWIWWVLGEAIRNEISWWKSSQHTEHNMVHGQHDPDLNQDFFLLFNMKDLAACYNNSMKEMASK